MSELLEVTIVKDGGFSDFKCPHCGHLGYIIKFATEETIDKVYADMEMRNLSVETLDFRYECAECDQLVSLPPGW